MSETTRARAVGAHADVTVGIDIGTTSVKAVAASGDGTVLAGTRILHRLVTSTDGAFEHEPDQAWRTDVIDALATVSAGLDVAAVCVAAMVPSLGAVDRLGWSLGPGLLYGDSRGAHEIVDPDLPGDGGELTAFLGWQAVHAPDAFGYWPAQAVANHALGDEGFIDQNTAMSTYPLFDLKNWDAAMANEAGATTDQLPRVVPALEPGGRIGDGRPCAGALLAGGTVDGYGEQLVSGATQPGDVLVIFGTTLITWAVVDGWLSASGLWSIPHHVPHRCLVGGPSNAGGLFIDLVERWLGSGPLGPTADGIAPDNVPVWLPYVRGERTPLHRRDLRASLHDIGVNHGPAQVRRAAHEASAFVVRHHLDLAAGAGFVARRIVAVGGGTHSDALMQALADGTGLPVDVAAIGEGAALGAAYLARCAAGLGDGLEGAAAWARTGRRVEPRPAWAVACNVRYARFRALSKAAVQAG